MPRRRRKLRTSSSPDAPGVATFNIRRVVPFPPPEDLIESSLPIITFDAHATIVETNRAAASLFSRPIEDLIGTSFSSLVAADNAEVFLRHLRLCRAPRTRPAIAELRLQVDHHIRHVEIVSFSCGPVHIRNMLLDVRWRHATLPPSDLAEKVFGLLDSPFAVIDQRFCIVKANAAMRHVFRIGASQIEGAGIFTLPRVKWDCAELRLLLDQGLASGMRVASKILECELLTPALRLTFMASVRRLNPGPGRDTFLLLHLQNVTARLEAELERERLLGELKELNEQLERRVEHRTTELTQVNSRLQQLSSALIEAQEAERRRLAIELHDEVGQNLTGMKLGLENLARTIPPESNGQMTEALAMASTLLGQVRKISVDLRPPVLEDLGFKAAIKWQVKQFEGWTGIPVHLRLRHISDKALTRAEQITLYRIVQESLNNVSKHSKATAVDVSLEVARGELRLSVQDNGQGFNYGQDPQQLSTGISGMRERANLLGGTVEVDSRPGKGTRVSMVLPLGQRDKLLDSIKIGSNST